MLQETQNQPLAEAAPERGGTLPPLLSLDVNKRQPSAALREEVGPALAAFIHNYQRGGPIYRYLDYYSKKVKTVLSGVRANRFAMRYGKDYLSAQQYRKKQTDELASDKYIVAMDGEAHYQMRKLQKPGYARSMLDTHQETLLHVVEQALNALQPDKPFAAYRLFQKVMTIQLGRTLLNHDSAHVWQHVCRYIDGMLEASFAPRYMQGERLAAYHASTEKTLAFADEMICAHQKGAPKADIITDLLAAVERDRSLMNEQELRVAILTPYIAGINPVAHTCAFLLYALLTHPDSLARVTDEVRDGIAQDGFSLKSVRRMKLLHAAILEALRLYPFAPVLEMTAAKPFEFDGYLVKPKTAVVLAITVPHFLDELYPDPFKFDIDRYAEGRAANRHPGAFSPYGVGAHICLGAGFSEDQMLLTMAALLNAASFQLAPNAHRPIVGLAHTNNFPVLMTL